MTSSEWTLITLHHQFFGGGPGHCIKYHVVVLEKFGSQMTRWDAGNKASLLGGM